jgi:hypothetical protein
MALTPQGDRIFYAEVLNGYWAASPAYKGPVEEASYLWVESKTSNRLLATLTCFRSWILNRGCGSWSFCFPRTRAV